MPLPPLHLLQRRPRQPLGAGLRGVSQHIVVSQAGRDSTPTVATSKEKEASNNAVASGLSACSGFHHVAQPPGCSRPIAQTPDQLLAARPRRRALQMERCSPASPRALRPGAVTLVHIGATHRLTTYITGQSRRYCLPKVRQGCAPCTRTPGISPSCRIPSSEA